ncbi:MAG: hypothetical protein PF442_07885 [Desulfobulbaceae bacterium]|jgi:hypothetical protein|nr:hypothetical protein [Desulfobulbaceae bacterium]
MKPDLNYYQINDLLKRWKEYGFSEEYLLQYGASGELQFSRWISPPKWEYRFEYIIITCGHYESKRGHHPSGEYKIPYGERILFDVPKEQIDQLLNSNIDKQTGIALIPRCDEDCQICRNLSPVPSLYAYCSEGRLDEEYLVRNYLDVNPDIDGEDAPGLIKDVTKKDLVVTLENVRKFEKDFLEMDPQKSPYLDPARYGYSEDLAIIISTRDAVIEEKNILATVSAKQAGIAYIKKYYPNSGLHECKIDRLAAYALAGISHPTLWNQFIKDNEDVITS